MAEGVHLSADGELRDHAGTHISTDALSGGGKVISQQLLTGAAATIAFTGIPQTFNHLRIVVLARSSDAGAGGANVLVRFNGDEATNYDWVLTDVKDETEIHLSEVGQGLIYTAFIPKDGDTAAKAGHGIIDIPFYNLTTYHKMLSFQNACYITETAAGVVHREGSGCWNNTAAITSITLSLDSGNYMIGSAAYLYGIA
jgi:hypothetical protein